MRHTADQVVIVWADLPTPDVVVVRHPSGAVTVVADHAVPRPFVDQVASRNVASFGAGIALDDT